MEASLFQSTYINEKLSRLFLLFYSTIIIHCKSKFNLRNYDLFHIIFFFIYILKNRTEVLINYNFQKINSCNNKNIGIFSVTKFSWYLKTFIIKQNKNIYFFSVININLLILMNKNSDITTYTKKINTQNINNSKQNNR